MECVLGVLGLADDSRRRPTDGDGIRTMATIEHRLAADNLRRSRSCSNNWQQHDPSGHVSARPATRAAYGDAVAIQTQHRGNMAMWLDQSQNVGYETTRPAMRAPSSDARENLLRSRDGQVGLVMDVASNEGYYSARPVPRIKLEAREFAQRDQGTKLVDDGSGAAPTSSRAVVARVKPEAAANQLRNAGVLSSVLVNRQAAPATARPAPRVKPEAEEIALRNRGSTHKLFTMYGRLPESSRAPPRVKPEALQNAQKSRGSMNEIMAS